jgi:hypothetical protein
MGKDSKFQVNDNTKIIRDILLIQDYFPYGISAHT